MHVCHFFNQSTRAIITKWEMTSSCNVFISQDMASYMSDVFFSSGKNGDVEYYEEFPIRLVHQFEGIMI